MVERRNPLQAIPLSNSEVIKLINQEYYKKMQDDGGMHFSGNEHGNELRK